jgi:hypothetical protein
MRSALSLLTMKEKEKTMKNPRFSRNTVTAVALAMAMLVILTPFAHAEGKAKGAEKISNLRARVRADVASQSSDRRDQDQYSQEELEQERSALLELAGSVKDLTDLAPNYFDTDRLDEATKQIAEFSYQQLTVLRKGLKPSKMSEKLAAVRASIAEYKGSIQSQSAGRKPNKGGVVGIATDPFPSRSPFCHDSRGDETTRIPVGVLLAVDVVYFIAETVSDIAQDGCNEVLVVLGEGGNGRLVCIATDVIYVIAHAVFEGVHFCNEEFTDATVDANYERLGHIHDDLAASVANDNSNKTMIVSNDNSNKTTIIAEVDAKATALSSQISAGTTDILNKIESKGNDIINNDNTNRTQIINNGNTNTANIITNANANKTMIINNDNANFAATINELRALGCDIIRLLNTPEGQRSSAIASCVGKPGYPYNFPGNKSVAPAPASVGPLAERDDPSVARGQNGVPIVPLMGTVTMETHLLEGRLIPTYYLPSTRGGMIEQVKLLVWNTIESQLELNIAKDETEQAKVAAQQADQLLAKRKYLEAYRLYCVAYQKLVPVN